MAEAEVDELGPVDVLVIEFPAGQANLTGEMAAAMAPGSVAGVLVWENRWAAPFASAARRAGGQLVANGRIPIEAIVAAMEADEASMSEGD